MGELEKSKRGGKGHWCKMLPNGNDLFWQWKSIYEELLDPYTKTVDQKYFFPILDTQLKCCKKTGTSLSIVILNIQNLPNFINNILQLETYLLIKDITNKIRKRLSVEDMLFYDGSQTFLFLFPKTDKENVRNLTNDIKKDIEQIYLNDTPLTIKGGYAEFPTDAIDPVELQECAKKALAVAGHFNKNRIIGYFNERRKSIRVPMQVETRYIAPGFCERLACSRNISETGIMLSGMPDLPLGDNIKITFSLPKITENKITVMAKTIWNKIILHTGKIDTGLCFTCIDDRAKEQIGNFISGTLPPFVHL